MSGPRHLLDSDTTIPARHSTGLVFQPDSEAPRALMPPASLDCQVITGCTLTADSASRQTPGRSDLDEQALFREAEAQNAHLADPKYPTK